MYKLVRIAAFALAAKAGAKALHAVSKSNRSPRLVKLGAMAGLILLTLKR